MNISKGKVNRMNCECIYYSKDATEEELMVLAEKINNLDCDIEPVSIAVVNDKTKVIPDYDGYGKPFYMPEKSLVLFVYGKYHYMNNFKVGNKTFKSCFLPAYEFGKSVTDFPFEDIKMFDEE